MHENTGHRLYWQGKRNDFPMKSGWIVALCQNSGDFFKAYYDKTADVFKNAAGIEIAFGGEGRENDRWYELDEVPEGVTVHESMTDPDGRPELKPSSK